MKHRNIDPDQAPGGLVIRVMRADGTVVVWDAIEHLDNLDDETLASHVDAHEVAAMANAPSRLDVFDGDTGERTVTYLVIAVDS